MTSREADFYKALDNGSCRCGLCPHRCLIAPGKTGRCRVRRNLGGKLYSESYGRIAAVQIDPIEKKPLADFMPGTTTFSIGTLGCNLACKWCQNDSLSYADYAAPGAQRIPEQSPQDIVRAAIAHNCPSISYTYNEPTVFAEFVIDTAKLAREQGLKNVLVTNGYITLEAAKELYRDIDAANIDVKGFTEEFYRKNTGGELAAVIESAKYFHSLGKHLELTMLIVPTINDDLSVVGNFLEWVKRELSSDVVLHFSAFHPAHLCMNLPRTPVDILLKIREMAVDAGIRNVKLGNI
ncbi:MAG: AmmeMemoRadiSam system radical SAM enzyme [Victivallaceae bacterium]|nr:AmmeMemoRadiSam system radical SAM enzyme [Victivallaceae bacterium]